jgi:hypothetical protein
MTKTEKTTNTPAFSRAIRCFLSVGFLPILALTLTAPTSYAGIEAVRIATGSDVPLHVCTPPEDNTRLFVAEQHGKIINVPPNTVNPTPFLDISSEVGQGQGRGFSA